MGLALWILSAALAPSSLAASDPIRFGFLELRLPGPPGSEPTLPAPFHLVYPITLAGLDVRSFLEASDDQAGALLSPSLATTRRLTQEEKQLLAGLRFLAAGRPADAHGNLAQAAKTLKPALRECLQVNAALLLYLAGMPEEAEIDWLRAVNGGGGDGPREGAWRNLYSLYLTRRDFGKAHSLVEDALRARPDNRWAQIAKGFLLRMLGTEDEWEGFLRDKSSWKDSLHGIQIAYGKFLAEQGQYEEAVRYYNRGLEGAPANGPAWLELADVYYRLGYLVFSEECMQQAFHHGIADPYVFELYAKVLVDFSEMADTGRVMQGMGFRLDTAWASRQWRRAERIVEDGLPKALHSRSMTQLLYRLYCRNGRVEAARNLRSDMWFHFLGPAPPARCPRLAGPVRRGMAGITPRLTYVTFPLVLRLQLSDYYEMF